MGRCLISQEREEEDQREEADQYRMSRIMQRHRLDRPALGASLTRRLTTFQSPRSRSSLSSRWGSLKPWKRLEAEEAAVHWY